MTQSDTNLNTVQAVIKLRGQVTDDSFSLDSCGPKLLDLLQQVGWTPAAGDERGQFDLQTWKTNKSLNQSILTIDI
jgi:hypothetical protein